MSPFVQVAWPQGTLVQDTASVRVASADDVRFADIAPASYSESTALYLPYSTTTGCAGMRFALPIPQGATITAATLELVYRNNALTWTTPSDDRTLGAEQVDNAATILTRTACLDRYTNLGTTANWANTGVQTQHEVVANCPSLVTAIQEVIDRAGWASGNYLAIWMYTTAFAGADHAHQGFVTTEAQRPRLVVDFEYLI